MLSDCKRMHEDMQVTKEKDKKKWRLWNIRQVQKASFYIRWLNQLLSEIQKTKVIFSLILSRQKKE